MLAKLMLVFFDVIALVFIVVAEVVICRQFQKCYSSFDSMLLLHDDVVRRADIVPRCATMRWLFSVFQ